MAEPPTEQHAQEQRIEDALAALSGVILAGMSRGLLRSNSRWALETAASAAGTNGVSGTLIVQLPVKPTDHIEVMYVTGETDVVSRASGRSR